MIKCKVEACNKEKRALGYCMSHYDNFRNYGDPLYQKQMCGENRKKHPLYGMYLQMKNRCYNPKTGAYKYYGARGITVCDEWLGLTGFSNFVKDMGIRPENTSLDRRRNDLGYSKENCWWANAYEQARNTRSNNIKIGVSLHKRSNKFRAYIIIKSKQLSLGEYNKFEDAVKARVDAEIKYKVYETN